MHMNKLPNEIRKALKNAFNETNMYDLYQGDVEDMLKVIGQTLKEQREKLRDAELATLRTFESAQEAKDLFLFKK